ncbi:MULTISPECIES: fructose-1,6-bisphosphatase [unclassified Aerococcus]|uniref:fructose-1,6-bisphosphatase n=2 Tax=unclassified Aerococcus TaxID=2618060 RepID=UPI000B1A28EB|nr:MULTISPECIES: fructose-1,6-bisphosphatase [unclassified Aerococcus]
MFEGIKRMDTKASYTHDRYLQLLAQKFPNQAAATTEIINLEAIMELPKGTEHFMSDLHGEFNAFNHVLRNGSGNIKEKISEVFGSLLSQEQRNELATIIYYPEEMLAHLLPQFTSEREVVDFYYTIISRLVKLAQFVVSKYTRSKVRKAMAKDMAYIMEELIFKDSVVTNKEYYYHNIVENIIELNEADLLVVRLSELIRELVVDHLHILGDIYDRGDSPDKIIDLLMEKKSLDIQWGNHDVIWMGAASGSRVLIANVIRICARYDNLNIIEDAYGISLRQLVSFVDATYSDDDLGIFMPKLDPDIDHFPAEIVQIAKMQQAMAIIQFKLEAAIIKRHPEFNCDNRLLLDKIDFDKGQVFVDGNWHRLLNTHFPTVDPEDPYRLTEDEEMIMDRLQEAFLNCDRLHKHIAFLYRKGGIYKCYNDNLLFHGCIPFNEDHSFKELEIDGKSYGGRTLMDKFDKQLRLMYSFRQADESKNPYLDYCWYLWQGEASSLFGKKQMRTFERYYVKDKDTHEEYKNTYYSWREEEACVDTILEEFNLPVECGHVINGHTPVKEIKGEDPIKANGKLLVIDGGFSKAYQSTTGLAGYTLLFNSFGMQLVCHQAFKGVEDVVMNGTDIISTRRVVDKELERKTVGQTDVGQALKTNVQDLKDLLCAFRSGKIAEKEVNN